MYQRYHPTGNADSSPFHPQLAGIQKDSDHSIPETHCLHKNYNTSINHPEFPFSGHPFQMPGKSQHCQNSGKDTGAKKGNQKFCSHSRLLQFLGLIVLTYGGGHNLHHNNSHNKGQHQGQPVIIHRPQCIDIRPQKHKQTVKNPFRPFC